MKTILSLLALLLLFTGCVSVGRDFPAGPVGQIANGTTTRAQIRATFGEPYQTGLENGRESWTYLLVRYGAGGGTISKELHLVFDPQGQVESYSFTTTHPEDE